MSMSSIDSIRCPTEQEHEALLDDQLDDTSRQLIVNHVQNCARCQSICESLVARLEQGDHLTIIEPNEPEDPIERVMREVKDRLANSECSSEDRDGIEPTDLLALGSEFQLIQRLGQGAQGVVYQARELKLQRVVVIKLLAPKSLQSAESIERFKREARSLASIQSPHVVPIFRVSELPSGKMFMVLEFVQGTTLKEFQKSEKLGAKQSALIVQQIAVGLSAVHQSKLVHRDIKPENILIDGVDRKVRIADFGLAFDCNDEARITIDGTLAGTPAYMSPEQVLNPQSVDFRSDIYSLGVVLYELLTSQVPFRGTTRMTLLRLVHEDPTPPRSYDEAIPKDLETICLKALSKDPARRFQSANEFADELDRFLSDQPIRSRPVGRVELFWSKVKKNPVVSFLFAVVALLVCFAAAVSSAYAIHYRTLNTRAEQNALIAKQQRDSALSTLIELVFQLQRKFDSDEIQIDDIQQSSLEIAMRGLEKVEGSAGMTNEGGLAMAVALRRLGQTFYNSDRLDESSRCLAKSEQMLRQLLTRQPRNHQVVLALADTVIAYDGCLDEENDDAQLERFAFAAACCRKFTLNNSPEGCDKFAALLVSQARCQMQNEMVDKAIESLQEAERTVHAPTLADDSHKRLLRITSLEVQTYLACAHRIMNDLPSAQRIASKTLEQIEQLEDDKEDTKVIQAQLCCLELLGCMANKVEQNAEPRWLEMYARLRKRLLQLVETDKQEFAIDAEMIMLLVNDRLHEGMQQEAMDLLTLRMDLAEARLAILPQDSVALFTLFDSRVTAAGIELERESRRGYLRALGHCFQAFACVEKMNEAGPLSHDAWESLMEAVDTMRDCFEELRDSAPQRKLAEEWARKILQWSSDKKRVQQAKEENLHELRETCEEIVSVSVTRGGEYSR
jgi:serine/threonine protein kinase